MHFFVLDRLRVKKKGTKKAEGEGVGLLAMACLKFASSSLPGGENFQPPPPTLLSSFVVNWGKELEKLETKLLNKYRNPETWFKEGGAPWLQKGAVVTPSYFTNKRLSSNSPKERFK